MTILVGDVITFTDCMIYTTVYRSLFYRFTASYKFYKKYIIFYLF